MDKEECIGCCGTVLGRSWIEQWNGRAEAQTCVPISVVGKHVGKLL